MSKSRLEVSSAPNALLYLACKLFEGVGVVDDRPKKLDGLMRFCAEQRRCLVHQIGEEWFAFGPPAFHSEISQRVRRGEKSWSD